MHFQLDNLYNQQQLYCLYYLYIFLEVMRNRMGSLFLEGNNDLLSMQLELKLILYMLFRLIYLQSDMRFLLDKLHSSILLPFL
jgi:uncharacterized protein (DUF486 family)